MSSANVATTQTFIAATTGSSTVDIIQGAIHGAGVGAMEGAARGFATTRTPQGAAVGALRWGALGAIEGAIEAANPTP